MVTRLASLFDHPSLYIHQFIVDSNLGDVCQQKKRHPSIAILPIMVSVDLLRQQRCLFTRNHTYSLSINLVLKDSEALLILTVNRGHRALRYVRKCQWWTEWCWPVHLCCMPQAMSWSSVTGAWSNQPTCQRSVLSCPRNVFRSNSLLLLEKYLVRVCELYWDQDPRKLTDLISSPCHDRSSLQAHNAPYPWWNISLIIFD